MLLLLMTKAGCTAGAGTRHAPPPSLLSFFPSSSHPCLLLLVLLLLLSLLCHPPAFSCPSSFPFFSSSVLFCYLNHTCLSSIVRVCLPLPCFALLLLLLLLVTVMKEFDCMAGAQTRSKLLLLCHHSNVRPGCLIFSPSSPSLCLCVLHDAVAADTNHAGKSYVIPLLLQ